MFETTTDVIIDEGFNQDPIEELSWFKKMIAKFKFHFGKILLKFGIKTGLI